jgi:glutathione S-transferase
MTAPLLFTYRRCPYAMRARMALLVAGIAFDCFEIVLRDKPATLLALSTKATVPVLQLPDGRVLEESWDIVEWALASQDPQGWWSQAQPAENLNLLARNDGLFKHHLDRYKYPERYSESDRNLHREQGVAALLLPLENQLQHYPYLGGVSPCATDIGLFPFVRQFAAVEPPWFLAQPLPAVQAWLVRWLASPLFQACMVKLPSQTASSFPSWTEAMRVTVF